MYIAPDTNISLLSNIPLTTTYEYSIDFNSKEEQQAYFISMAKYSLNHYTYQRVNKNIIRIGIKADSLYDCNYMMFQNSAFGDKWFYAFIKQIEYINNEVSEVEFEIDVLQTWMFNYQLLQTFVERSHTPSDEIGEHIESEPVAIDEYIMNDYSFLENLSEMAVIIAICDTEVNSSGTLYDGIYGGCDLYAYDSTDASAINSKLNEYTQKPDSIISLYMLPLSLLGGSIPTNHKIGYSSTGLTSYIVAPTCSREMTLNGYKPKNMKLYTYPYNFYHCDNANGSSLVLRYEFFENLTPVLMITGTITQPIELMLRPCSYKGVKGYDELGGYTTLNTETLSLNNFPLCSWNFNAYDVWIAQNSVPLTLNTVSNLGQLAIQAPLSANPKAAVATGIISQISNVLSQFYQASIASDICRGNINNGGANVVHHTQMFYGGQCSISKQQAQIIDDFFTMYGYAIKRTMKPDIKCRRQWNYIKTIGLTIKGSVPCDDMRKICNIYDNGITFWHNPANVGNYTLDNSPII